MNASMGSTVVGDAGTVLFPSVQGAQGTPVGAAGTGISTIILEPWQEILQWTWWVMVYLGSFSLSPLLFAVQFGERLWLLPQWGATGPGGSMRSRKWGESFLSLGLPRAGSTWNTRDVAVPHPGGVGMEDLPYGRKGMGDISDLPLPCFSKHWILFAMLFCVWGLFLLLSCELSEFCSCCLCHMLLNYCSCPSVYSLCSHSVLL